MGESIFDKPITLKQVLRRPFPGNTPPTKRRSLDQRVSAMDSPYCLGAFLSRLNLNYPIW